MTKVDRKYYRIILSITALITGCFFFIGCENDEGQIDSLLKRKTGIEEGTKIESYLSQDGKMKAKLTAPFLLRHMVDTPYLEFPRSLHVDFYNDTLRIESTLDARYAKYRETERKVLLKDSVRVINIINRDTLETSELWWDQNTQEFFTDKPVVVRQPDKTIYGKNGLKAAQNFTWYYFYGTTGTVLTGPDGILE